ncbi:unnamed protein product [Acanthoscelides obtectus]|uniref:Chibby n=1 Tax=Acanthoscelides obtectus TaxID=200917 RepID=A0A9P0LZH9_ACAOB|nr:unnamed protein product [Acanthoscelides obtectus]CAK1629464.1 Protein chibby homolog 1 [Acanthoscelides obtectus]
MPLFGNKFSPKRTPIRKSSIDLVKNNVQDLVSEGRVVYLNLGDQKFKFDDGEWIPEGGEQGSIHKTKQKLKKKLHEVEEENNMLKLKYEMMLNMLTEATIQKQEREELDVYSKKK